ncbi:MAG: hypothetical protein AB1490_06935 [Pseudomonadota bacterium]
MRKAALALAALAAVCLTTTADAAKKKAAPAADPAVAAQNNTAKFVGDGFAPWQATQAAPAPAKKARKGKKKAMKKK